MELTKEKIEELKKEYGSIFQVTISGKEYVYRSLKRKEYKEIQSRINPVGISELSHEQAQELQNKLEEEIVKTCVLFPVITDMDNIEAGLPSILSPLISQISGYEVQEEPREL